jgi:superfamily II RNA helicase
MVKICPNTYPVENEQKLIEYFEKYPFPLSSFQKWAIQSIVEGNHILVTAHTGSGKTLPAEFAIEYFTQKKKKVIYTSPIKALSNQKFYEFTQKFPHISFGILTGDIKFNPEADVLIMTAEILLNTLYAKKSNDKGTNNNNASLSMFNMDFENDLECVVMDEVHFVNDLDRGKVWEETIMMLPKHIQMVMLSATLDSPEKFALWCENRGTSSNTSATLDKVVYLTTTYERVVPLTHYSFITCGQGIFKILKDKTLEMEVMRNTNTLHVIQDSKGNFNDINYQKIKKTLVTFENKHHYVKRQHVLNSVTRHMVDNNMLPAICFILSRKALEQCSKEVTTCLLEDDSKVPYLVRRECEQIIRKLPNYQEYLNLPEYLQMIYLLEKGIAIHHAGIMPVLREMVELLFSKGYVKLLFATETFAVGINMPTKTVLFTDLNKFNGTSMRPLFSHEYTQMAGRAGRRGIDTVGHVIHLTNLFKDIDSLTLKTIMKGKPQTLVSKFKISYNFILNLIDIGETNYSQYAKKSMIQGNIEQEINNYRNDISVINVEINKMTQVLEVCKTPMKTIEEYIDLNYVKLNSIQKKRKETEKKIKMIVDEYSSVEQDSIIVTKYKSLCKELLQLNNQLYVVEQTIDTNIQQVLQVLMDADFINNIELNKYELTIRGQIGTQIKETHCIIFAKLIEQGKFKRFCSKELVGIFSCFTNISVPEDKRNILPTTEYKNVKDCIVEINELYDTQYNLELFKKIDTGFDYTIHFDLIDYVMEWCSCEDEIQCKQLIQKILWEKDIFLGEFVKSILKINNIASEMEKIAEMLGDIEFLSIVKAIPKLTLKYVATNQSLYV